MSKDNPVPSLTKREKEVLLECLEIANEQHGEDPSKEEIASLISKINGVETNKVQPNCKYIKREGESCTLNNNCKYPNCNEPVKTKCICFKYRCECTFY